MYFYDTMVKIENLDKYKLLIQIVIKKNQIIFEK